MREAILNKLMELEEDATSMHHFYFTGKSISSLETYGFQLIDRIEKNSQVAFKGIVKHFSVIMPYFDNKQGAEKFIQQLKESVSIAKDCYDEYKGIILIEGDREWGIHGTNDAMKYVLEYMQSLSQVRYVFLSQTVSDKENFELYTALATIGVWAFVEIEDIDFKAYLEKWCEMIAEAGFYISDDMKTELCILFEERRDEIADVGSVLSQWLKQLVLNRKFKGSINNKITIEDIRLLSGINIKKGSRTIGFGTGR